jgi:hypothetical protein
MIIIIVIQLMLVLDLLSAITTAAKQVMFNAAIVIAVTVYV